ncbi:ATP-binding protein [Nisaea acidiphila]|uniref:ATP-binding protein n=1 Tax=Nisaea acidiphila TaxID=1862145 RepID=A0A9J7AVP3_9PROT|nr:ATP-binding protein [Nisaea acidiphila]UUX51843.1 ATP-binding protein [Nisaea acidiphila]
MLGRQQIAGIPTALHELLKNAHDAYAERAEIDFIRRNRMLVLRDDGYGMTREDVENRWLTIGTESRVGANKLKDSWTGPKNLPRRALMGEKGIGRLAIAVIAPVTLLMTRAIRPDTGLNNLVVALVHWGLFEQPGLDISQIDVPIEEFPDGTLPDSSDIENLNRQVIDNIDRLSGDIGASSANHLKSTIANFRFDPEKMDKFFSNQSKNSLSLKENSYGTHFVMLPTGAELEDDIRRKNSDEASQLEKVLLGFSNTIDGREPVLATAFRDHALDGEVIERISEREFLGPDDFRKGDHWLDGSFDEYGQFRGKISIYHQEPIEFVCNWPDGKGRPAKCGPFSIKFAYVNGDAKSSLLSPEEHKEIKSKLDLIGGLYIYRNGIRILPYGSSDYDFLGIETRRGKSAQDWFFAYRRFIGFVSIDQDHNSSLSEKAGREGFRQNIAYRDFRDILTNLFVRLALEFFRTSSPQSDQYWDKNKELNREFRALERQRKNASKRRKYLDNSLKEFFEKYESDNYKNTSDEIITEAERRLDSLSNLSSNTELALYLDDVEEDFIGKIRGLEAQIVISKPRNLSLRGRLEKDWNAYLRIAEKLKIELVDQIRNKLSARLADLRKSRVDPARTRERSIAALAAERTDLVRSLTDLRNQSYAATESMRASLRAMIKEEFSKFRAAVEELISDFTSRSAKDPEIIDQLRGEIESRLLEIRNTETEFFNSIRRNMEDLAEDLREGQTTEDRLGAIEQEMIHLEAKVEFLSDFAQVGMSVGILQHEFEKSAHDLRRAMRDLKPWADGTPDLRVIYNRMRQSFDYLDDYLKTLDPLGRRMVRRKVDLRGDDIRIYLHRIFDRRLNEDDIELIATSQFNGRVVKCHAPTLLGAFVNVLDNAIYWVSNGADGERKITLSADDKGFLISNTGPGIEEKVKDRIFDFGESTRPGGRGMGLAIARDVLARDDFRLELAQWGRDKQPIFRIVTEQDNDDDDHDDG